MTKLGSIYITITGILERLVCVIGEDANLRKQHLGRIKRCTWAE